MVNSCRQSRYARNTWADWCKKKIQILSKKAAANYNTKKSGKIDVDLDVYTECLPCSGDDNVFIFRDSYIISLFPNVSKHFKNIHYISRNGIDWSIVKNEKTTLIIEQIIERSFATFKVNLDN